MPARLSKFSIEGPTCKDFTHPWVDSCLNAQVGLGLHALQQSLRIYSTVYLFALLMRGKKPTTDDIIKTILGILQSSVFLSWSGFTYPVFICALRKLLGNFNILTVSFIPSFLSSLSAIIIERPSRRPLLSLYVANIATETLFRMGVWRGYFKSIPYGNVYIFGVSMAALMYLYRSKNPKNDTIFKLVKFIVSKYEDPSCSNEQMLNVNQQQQQQNENNQSNDTRSEMINGNRTKSIILKSLKTYNDIINWIKSRGKHVLCSHPHSCVDFIIKGFIKLFSFGFCIQVGLKLVLQFKQITKIEFWRNTLWKKNILNLPLFLGGFSGLYRLISCLLRRTTDKDTKLNGLIAGLLASASFIMYQNNTIALYVMWKSLQLLWKKGVEANKLPDVKWFPIFLYCFSTAVLFHAAIIEPHNLRSSYWKFLVNISGRRVAAMSRIPLEPFGLNSYENLQKVLKQTNTKDHFPTSY